MKPRRSLLNVARGGIIDEAALADALARGRSAGAGDRRLRARAARPDSPLLDAPNTLLTPHLGASTAEAQVARGRGGRGPDRRRARRPAGPLRGQRPAADARDGRRDRAVPAARRDARPVLRPVRPARRRDADRRRGRRAGRATTPRRSPPPCSAASSRPSRPSGSTSSTPARWRRPAASRRRAQDADGGRVRRAADPVGRRSRAGRRPSAGRWPAASRASSASNDYRLDMAPTEFMLVTQHTDRPGHGRPDRADARARRT